MGNSNIISVLVATYNRPQALKNCLVALSKQTLVEFNIIVINDGGLNVDKNIVRDIFKKYPLINVTVINRRKNIGSSSVRNVGFKMAPDGLVAFTDDDAIPEPDWLEQIKQYFKEYPMTTVLSGHINAVSLRYVSERLRQAYYDYRDYIYSGQKYNALFAEQYGLLITKQNLTDWIGLGNCAIRKTSSNANKPLFDTSRKRNYAHKLAKSLLQEGKIVTYSSMPRVRHDHRRNILTLIDIRRQNAINSASIDNENHVTFPVRLHVSKDYLFYMFVLSHLRPRDKFIELLLSLLFIACYSTQTVWELYIKRKENNNDKS